MLEKENDVGPPCRAPHSICMMTIPWGVVMRVNVSESDSSVHSTYYMGGQPCWMSAVQSSSREMRSKIFSSSSLMIPRTQ